MLRAHNLQVHTSCGESKVHGVDLHLQRGQVHALVGESGSGKTLTATALVDLLPRGLTGSADRVLLDGSDITTPDARRAVRGRGVAMVFQDPAQHLDPVHRVGQVLDAIRTCHHNPRSAESLCQAVGLPTHHLRAYPHELSGGQQQRALLATALAAAPRVLIADEPTRGLDPIVAERVLRCIRRLADTEELAVLLIAHDLHGVRRIADRVSVMQEGRIVETAPTATLFEHPVHPYTRRLLSALEPHPRQAHRPGAPILEVHHLHVEYPGRSSSPPFQAVQDVHLEVAAGEVLAVLGPSGSGKSSVVRAIAGLVPSRGRIRVGELDLGRRRSPALCRRLQLLFQDARGSFHPRRSLRHSMERALRWHGREDQDLAPLARRVGLDPTCLERLPSALSGGQCQRAAILRALSLEPEVLLCDESVSALDVSLQAVILELLDELCRERNLAMVLVTHDLRVARRVADRVVVLHKGHVVEQGPCEQVLTQPRSPLTRALIRAAGMG